MKNNTLDMRRFALLCRKEWLESWKGKLSGRVWVPILVFMVVMWWNYYMNCKGGLGGQDPKEWLSWINRDLLMVAFWYFAVYAIVSTSYLMKRVAERKNRASWLLTPASALEKYLVSTLGTLASLFVIFPLAFLLEEVLRVLVFSSLFPELPVEFVRLSAIVGTGSSGSYGVLVHDMTQFHDNVLMGLSLFSLFVLGASLWPKNSVGYTLIAVVLLFLGYTTFVNAWVELIYPEGWESVDGISDAMMRCGYGLFSWHMQWMWMKWVMYAGIPFCWILAYYRFKELEIINRW